MTVYLGVWCPTREQDCVPLQNGCCGFCDTRVVDRDGNPLHTQPKEAQAVQHRCKIDGCVNPSAGKGGWCSGLCDNHISQEGARRQRVRAAKAREAAASSSKPVAVASAAPPSSLVALAQAVEDAKASLELALAALREAVAAA